MDWDVFLKSVAQLAIGVTVVCFLVFIVCAVIWVIKENFNESE